MKLITYKYEGEEDIGILRNEDREVVPLKELGYIFGSMNRLIVAWEQIDHLELEKKAGVYKGECLHYSDVLKMPPIITPMQDVICLGLNYEEHTKETSVLKDSAPTGRPQNPIYFSKRVNEAVGDGGFVETHGGYALELDYEVELGIIIGKDAKNVPKDQVFDYVMGYTIINDISERYLQRTHTQWYLGKSLDGFTPMGPCIVTKDQFENPPVLKIMSRVNGELRQNSSTDNLIFSIPHIISELSRGMTLKAGTIIATGTPSGVGMGFNPPKYLKPGDVVECEIQGIGILRNVIR